ncbi:MAG TPA: hypothetical protein VNQ79_19195 [Blastocatellia bacterium]|nr:hypothetical protein [Blastocatellia bacterium]
MFFRLSVFPVSLPPLRERKEDIPLLVRHFIRQAQQQGRCGKLQINEAQMARLQRYDWPGNIRELQNLLERAMILSRCGALPVNLNLALPESDESAANLTAALTEQAPQGFVTQAEWEVRERQNLMTALAAANWKIYGAGGAAELLGVKATTLASRLKALGIRKMRGSSG